MAGNHTCNHRRLRTKNLKHRVQQIAVVLLLAGEVLSAHGQTTHKQAKNKYQESSPVIPEGIILPVRLHRALNSRKDHEGTEIRARVMQAVPLPSGASIEEGAEVLGHISQVKARDAQSGARITIRFEQLQVHGRQIPLSASLRALAGFMEVQAAQTPENSPGFGTPYNWTTTRLIGGDEKYGVGGVVTNSEGESVGIGQDGGVLTHVRARAGTNCRGSLDAEDRLQALWVFSADACGVYGIEGLKIAHAGKTPPMGEIVLEQQQGDVRVPGASALLLRVIR